MGIITDLIYQSILEKKQNEEKRNYLGFSEVGHECCRYLWLSFHKPELRRPLNEKQAVIFENGHWVEKKLIHQMRQAGFDITDQQIEMNLFNGKFQGHCDGIINHPEYGKVILEIKGLQKSDWNKYKKHGVRLISSTYYGQGVMLAGYLDLPGTYWIAENKDNQELYEEFIPSNKTEYTMLCRKAESIIFGTIPKGISTRADWWKCVHCQFNHENACRKNWEGESPF